MRGGKPEIDFPTIAASRCTAILAAGGGFRAAENVLGRSMNGWFSVLLIGALLIAAAVVLIRQAARGWWDYLLILALAGLLFRPLYSFVSGDVSRYLPAFFWSDGSDGKDQIIFASIASTFLLPLVVSALILLIVSWIVAISRS